jgi:uncharacterized membrane protein YdbT with pleckstrin-like domain
VITRAKFLHPPQIAGDQEGRMSYVQQVLQPDETVRFRTTLHWSIYLAAIIALGIGLAFLVWHYLDQKANLLLLLGAIAFGVPGVVLALAAGLKRFGTEVAVTDRRVIYKTGLIHRHTVEINLDKVESVDVDQSVMGRLFGYGTVTIRGTGQAVEPLRDMADPLQFRSAILAR